MPHTYLTFNSKVVENKNISKEQRTECHEFTKSLNGEVRILTKISTQENGKNPM